MNSPTSPNDLSAYLESLMQAGQQSTKLFDEALATAMGVHGDQAISAEGTRSPFAASLQFQRELMTTAWQFWSSAAKQVLAFNGQPELEPARGDRRFRDESWQTTPFYDLLKQSYLATAKQMQEQVEQAPVDDKAKLQLRFYARQFIDALSPSNFPATNPEVIRKAIETRSASLSQGMMNFIEDVQKGRITQSMKRPSKLAAISPLPPARSSTRTN